MEQYNVTGMSCAACSARVEKAVSKVPGVTACSVSLLTNSMGVEGTADPQEIIQAVENAGYGASARGRRPFCPGRPGGGGPGRPRHPGAEKAPHQLPGLPGGADVLLHGPTPWAAGRCRPFSRGNPAALGLLQLLLTGGGDGDQPEILRQRL